MSTPFRRSAAIYVASSRVFDFLLDHRSAEVLLLACLARHPDYRPALSSYGRLAARVVSLQPLTIPCLAAVACVGLCRRTCESL